jgi:hypothetical protein
MLLSLGSTVMRVEPRRCRRSRGIVEHPRASMQTLVRLDEIARHGAYEICMHGFTTTPAANDSARGDTSQVKGDDLTS